MATPTLEEREKILAEDPSSPVFEALASDLIERGDYLRAIEVCASGLKHHPDSILGRVLWGKALIHQGQAAASMEQFEQAIQVDRQNPYAYHLIGEVLLKKGLFRSALPILRKAALLQPEDARIKHWLDQAQAALARGPGAAWKYEDIPLPQLTPVPRRPEPPPIIEREVAIPEPDPPSIVEPTAAAVQPTLLSHVVDHSELAPPPPDSAEPVPQEAAAEIAKDYESQLHQEFKDASAKKSFLALHGWKVALAVVLGLPILYGAMSYLRTRSAHRGQDLKDAIAEARRSISKDTHASYDSALESLSHALQMDEGSSESWALTAYVQSILFAEHGAGPKARTKAQFASDRARGHPELDGPLLASELYLAEGTASKAAAEVAILNAKTDEPQVQELAGRLLMARDDFKGAVERLRRALKSEPGNIRALVALGDYYRRSGDNPAALKTYTGTAAQIAPDHPGRVLGAAESRLTLGIELEDALKEVEKLPGLDALPLQFGPRRELVLGRLLSVNGQPAAAIEKLSKGSLFFPTFSYEFHLALGDAKRAAGQMEAAQRDYEIALKAKPKSEDAIDALGRTLIARDREKEVLSRFAADPRSRRVSLIRGIAFAKLTEWKRARAELANTQLDGKFPSEAVLYLALADAAEGGAERAQSTLEKALAASRKAKGDLRVALGRIYWQRGILDKARFQFEEAQKDPEDFEGSCSLGRLLWTSGLTEAALEPLKRAVMHNGSHGEARHALGRAYLELGKYPESLTQFEGWQAESPHLAVVQKDLGLVYYYLGKYREADAALGKSLKLSPADAETHRIHAMSLFAQDNGRAAFQELERANQLNPKDPETFCEIGRAFVRQGNGANAIKAYAAALREDSESVCAKIGAHYARLPSGSRSAARELGEIAGKSPRPWNRSFAQATLARVLLSTGGTKEARAAAEKAVALVPSSGQAHFALGLVALHQKDETKAREELAKAAALDPSYGGIRLALADLLARRQEDVAEALEHYRAFLRIGGNPRDESRVKRLLPNLKKTLASR